MREGERERIARHKSHLFSLTILNNQLSELPITFTSVITSGFSSSGVEYRVRFTEYFFHVRSRFLIRFV